MYIISIENGEYEDFTSTDVFAAADAADAYTAMHSIMAEAKAICVAAQEQYMYNGEEPYRGWYFSDNVLERIIARAYDVDVCFVITHMPLGQLTDGGVEIARERSSAFFFYGGLVDTVPEVVDNDPITKFEALALNYERQLYGWRLH